MDATTKQLKEILDRPRDPMGRPIPTKDRFCVACLNASLVARESGYALTCHFPPAPCWGVVFDPTQAACPADLFVQAPADAIDLRRGLLLTKKDAADLAAAAAKTSRYKNTGRRYPAKKIDDKPGKR